MAKFHWIMGHVSAVLLLTIKYCDAATNDLEIPMGLPMLPPFHGFPSIYYSGGANSTLPIPLTMEATRLPGLPVKLTSRGFPCSCVSLKCGCCAGLNVTAIRFDRYICANVTVVPEAFALDLDLLVNEERVLTNRLTAQNPPPVCVPLYFLPVISFCVRFFDLHFANGKFNVCINFETQILQWPVFVLHFDCLNLGLNGVGWVNPTEKPAITNLTRRAIEYNGNL